MLNIRIPKTYGELNPTKVAPSYDLSDLISEWVFFKRDVYRLDYIISHYIYLNSSIQINKQDKNRDDEENISQ